MMHLYLTAGKYEAVFHKILTSGRESHARKVKYIDDAEAISISQRSIDTLEAHLKKIDNILKPLWAGYKNGVVNAII